MPRTPYLVRLNTPFATHDGFTPLPQSIDLADLLLRLSENSGNSFIRTADFSDLATMPPTAPVVLIHKAGTLINGAVQTFLDHPPLPDSK